MRIIKFLVLFIIILSCSDNYKKAYSENIARLDAERYAKSLNAEVQAEPLDMNQSRTSLITGAHSL